jgi:hypothetical protein
MSDLGKLISVLNSAGINWHPSPSGDAGIEIRVPDEGGPLASDGEPWDYYITFRYDRDTGKLLKIEVRESLPR